MMALAAILAVGTSLGAGLRVLCLPDDDARYDLTTATKRERQLKPASCSVCSASIDPTLVALSSGLCVPCSYKSIPMLDDDTTEQGEYSDPGGMDIDLADIVDPACDAADEAMALLQDVLDVSERVPGADVDILQTSVRDLLRLIESDHRAVVGTLHDISQALASLAESVPIEWQDYVEMLEMKFDALEHRCQATAMAVGGFVLAGTLHHLVAHAKRYGLESHRCAMIMNDLEIIAETIEEAPSELVHGLDYFAKTLDALHEYEAELTDAGQWPSVLECTDALESLTLDVGILYGDWPA
ncbi:hypothetical protein SDRG_07674 [Saprolegnia diclina VS20]|uniref:Secreted protein n=1 Tax=Saprolegnia diclina (strain VS20) TaxID=1156394 RepID=T0RQK1_SAPDV|nr:hypothetical protein SDRG_07674 [Saprolegnia diclina VS20]EQC34873.1 hypothetical protein SDRG_07674 [Saprolegnia diclina VS20]|eukprot:XP_008611745.1 hypothetical protein SDRG_07674 [Saprolegnia diclina VS20]